MHSTVNIGSPDINSFPSCILWRTAKSDLEADIHLFLFQFQLEARQRYCHISRHEQAGIFERYDASLLIWYQNTLFQSFSTIRRLCESGHKS